jgi:ketosteroid isomerase-like protein
MNVNDGPFQRVTMNNTSDTAAWIDQLAIRTVIDRYTDALNRQDWGVMPELFAANAVWQASGPFELRFEGRDAVVAALEGMVTTLEFLLQNNSAVVIELMGDRARARVSLSELGRDSGGKGLHNFGMYVDDLVKSEGEWRFERRSFHCRYVETTAVPGQVFPLTDSRGPWQS